MNDIAYLDATAQAELVRSKQVKPIELVEAAIERIERLNPQLNAVITPLYENARRTANGKVPAGPFTGVPFLIKDLGPMYAGARQSLGLRVPQGLGRADRQRAHPPPEGRRPHPRRQDQHAGVRPGPHDRAAPLRAQPQPLEHRAQHRRLQRRLSGGGGGRDGADGPRQRRRRLHPHPRFLLRPLRPQADARQGHPRPNSRRLDERPHQRPRHHPHRPRLRRPPGRDARLGAGRPVHRPGAGAPLRRRSRRGPRPPAHRLHHGGRHGHARPRATTWRPFTTRRNC